MQFTYRYRLMLILQSCNHTIVYHKLALLFYQKEYVALTSSEIIASYI